MAVALGLYAWGHFTARRPTGAGLIAIPVLCLIAVPILRRLARPDDQFDIVGVAWLALGTKFIVAYLRLLGGVDSVSYDNEGARMAEAFRQFDFTAPTGRSIPGTGSVRYFTGLVHLTTNSSYVATFLVYSFIAFLGILMFYRAFGLAVPEGNTRRYALLILFWPTLLFWPSSIGKESLMIFGLGLTSLGAARVLSRLPRGLLVFLVGLASVGLVRPHVALIIVTAMLVGLVFRAPVGDSLTAVGAKLVIILVLLIAGAVIAGATESLFDLDDLNRSSSVSEALNRAEEQTAQGGGRFASARVSSPIDYPWAVVTVLFRPFVFEAKGGLALLSATEGMMMLAVGTWSLLRFMRHVGRIRRSAYLAYALTFVLTFCYLFAAIANFGILTRKRSQVLPFLFVFFALPQFVPDRPVSAGDDEPARPTLKLAWPR